MNRGVLHAKDRSWLFDYTRLRELMEHLHMSFAYTEELGNTHYHHYDVWGVKTWSKAKNRTANR